MIEFDNVSFKYDANACKDSLSGVSFCVDEGQCVLLTGPSGCGKSTILRLINGLIPEFYKGQIKGKIIIDGKDITKNSIYDNVGSIGTVFQNPRSQFFNVDTTSELAFGCENLGIDEDEILSRIDITVHNFGIEKLMDRNIFELSGGEKQKIACASVDVLKSEIILLDEPAANLDYDATMSLKNMIAVWKNMGKTILIAEHRIGYLMDMIDEIIVLNNGMLVEKAKVSELNYNVAKRKQLGLRAFDVKSPFELISKNCNKGEIGQVIFKDFSYGYDRRQELFNLSELRINRGGITALVGENGAGKTTFLECVCGIRKCKGYIEINGRKLYGKDRLKETFLVMQDSNHQLFTESALDEVLISMPNEDREKAKQILFDVGLLDEMERHPLSLSGGQKQRLAIACAVASERKLLLLDEPTSGLDYNNMLQISSILRRLAAAGITIITVTHDSEFIECACDDVILFGNENTNIKHESIHGDERNRRYYSQFLHPHS